MLLQIRIGAAAATPRWYSCTGGAELCKLAGRGKVRVHDHFQFETIAGWPEQPFDLQSPDPRVITERTTSVADA